MATLTGTLSFESAKFTVSASYALTTTATGAKISFTSVSAKCTNYTVPDMELVVHVDVLGPTSAESASWNLYTYNGTFTKGKEYTRTVSKSLSVTKTTSAKTFTVRLALDSYVTATVTVPALASYSVSFNANGGTGAPSAQTKWYGKTLTLSSAKPTRTNYVFKNWNTKSDGSGTSYSPGGSYTGNLAMTLYAQWYAPYTVSYNANGHGTAPSSQVKVYNKALSLAGSMGQQGDYMFRSWNTKADGTGTAYAAGASYSGNANMTLYAIWYAPYAVYYNANGGSAPPATQHKVHGKALTLSTQVPTRTNYVFNGWNTNAAGTGTSYAKGASYTANASVTLYAKWIAPYTVTFDGNGGKGLASGVKVHGQDYTIPSTTPALADATFTGWNTKADGTGTAYAAGSKYAANANLKLYAQWRRHPGVTSYKVQRQSYDEDASAWVNDDEGTAALVTVSWRADVRYAPPTSGKSLSFTLQAYTSAAMTTAVGSAASVTASSASKSDSKLSYGTFSVRLGGPFAADSAYHVKATVKDAYGQTATRALVVPRSSFAIDVHPDGYVGFGGSAVSGAHRFYGNVVVENGTLTQSVESGSSRINVKCAGVNFARGETPSENRYCGFDMLDSGGKRLGTLEANVNVDGYLYVNMYAYSHVSGSGGDSGFRVRKALGSTAGASMTFDANTGELLGFKCDAARIASGVLPVARGGTGHSAPVYTNTVSDFIGAASGWTIESGAVARWGKVMAIYLRMTYNAAISVPASGNINNITVGTLKSGYRPCMASGGWSIGDEAGAAWYQVGADGVVTLDACEGTGAARTIASGQAFTMRATWIIA